MPDIKLLDCTLRDGGYVNSWNWGFAAAKDIIASLTRAIRQGLTLWKWAFCAMWMATTPM